MNEVQVLHVEQIDDVLGELEKAFFDIPFENSAFQTRNFVIAAQQTPARAYRVIGLQMMSRIQNVKNALLDKQLKDIDLEELRSKLQRDDVSEFDKRRAQIEIVRLESGRTWSDKLLNDALRDLDVLYTEFKKFPRYTRGQFEAEEGKHFKQRLERQMKAGGPMESLMNMNEDLPALTSTLAQLSGLLK